MLEAKESALGLSTLLGNGAFSCGLEEILSFSLWSGDEIDSLISIRFEDCVFGVAGCSSTGLGIMAFSPCRMTLLLINGCLEQELPNDNVPWGILGDSLESSEFLLFVFNQFLSLS